MGYTYSPKSGRYRDTKSGRFVSRETLTTIRDTFAERVRGEMAKVADAFNAGHMSAADFKAAMRVTIKQSTVAAYEFGKGGKEQMTSRDYGKIGHSLREQYKYLDRFIADTPNLTPEGIAHRAQLYAETAIGGYEEGRAEGLRVAGITTAVWHTVDNPCDVCGPLDGTTVDLEKDDLPPIHPACRCFLEPK